MIIPERCPECKEPTDHVGVWFVHTNTRNSDVQNGLLRLADVSVDFVLGCEECSATIMTVAADDVATAMTEGFRCLT